MFANRGGVWEPYDFNCFYKGYYPSCAFTAVAYGGGAFYLAGGDDKGNIRLFSSAQGGVWEPRSIIARSPITGPTMPSGKVIRILADEGRRQIYLICDSGQLVTLPDCPKCAAIRQICGTAVTGAALQNGDILITKADGGKILIPADEAAQYRISLTYLKESLGSSAVIVDLRDESEYRKDGLPGSINLRSGALEHWLSGQDKQRPIVFVCRVGLQADLAVNAARRKGFYQAYSLGGMLSLAHTE
ncbi:MAG: rhodanese-like domain-containing protein [Clostridiales bacterium]|nr:rhodanese-like domain-containing protein [Clostridiales bacterium]